MSESAPPIAPIERERLSKADRQTAIKHLKAVRCCFFFFRDSANEILANIPIDCLLSLRPGRALAMRFRLVFVSLRFY